MAEVEAVKGKEFAGKMKQNLHLDSRAGSISRHLKLVGGMVGAADYTHGANLEMTKLCEQWCTQQLAKVDASPCIDLGTHFEDGVALAHLLGALTERTIKVKTKARIVAVKLDNIQRCLDFIQKLPVDSRGLNTHDVYDGNLNQIVPLMLKLMKCFDPEFLRKLKGKKEPATKPVATTPLAEPAKPAAFHPSKLWQKAQTVRPGSSVFENLNAQLESDVQRVTETYKEETGIKTDLLASPVPAQKEDEDIFASIDALVPSSSRALAPNLN